MANVHFLTGRAGAGKTYEIFSRAYAAMQSCRHSVIIVPEQFTYETERSLNMRFGGLIGVQVVSFERLANRVLGVTERPFLSREGRRMIIRNVARRFSNELTVFKPIVKRAGLTQEVDALISQFKSYNISPEGLKRASAELNKKPVLSAKLHDLSVIYAGVQQYLDENFMDSEDALNALLDALPSSFIAGTDVFVDGFESFSAQLYSIIESLMKHAGSLTISLCMDVNENLRDAELFVPAEQTLLKLKKLANKCGLAISEQNCNYKKAGKSGALTHLESNMFAYPKEIYSGDISALEIIGATDIASEVEVMADKLSSLAHSGMRYRDMAVIVSDTGAYAPLIQRAFFKRSIPHFADEGRPLGGHAPVELMLAAVRAMASGINRVELLRIGKTMLAGVDAEELEAFENYCLARGITGGKLLLTPFERIAACDGQNGGLKDAYGNNIADIELAECAREKLVAPLIKFKANFSGTVSKRTQALYDYMEELNVRSELSAILALLNDEGREALMLEHTQVWNVLMELLSQLHAILGGVEVSSREYLELLNEAVINYSVGIIPATADQVLLGDISRTRSKEVRALFVLGCNEGLFPKPRFDDALLDDKELEELKALGIEVWADSRMQTQNDMLALYRSLSRADEKLYLSFAYSNSEKELVRSSFIDNIMKLYKGLEERSDIELSMSALPINEACAYSMLASNIGGREKPLILALAEYFNNGAHAKAINSLIEFSKSPAVPASFSKQMAVKLYGERLYTTVSRLETFRVCPFCHFMRYGLKVEKRREFTEKQADIGIFSHMALEAFISEIIKANVKAISEEFALNLINNILDRCINEYENGLLVSTARTRALSAFWMDAVRETALFILNGFKEGGFVPAAAERRFGPGQELNAIEAGGVSISGVIDRMDTIRAADGSAHIRVVDYKTGTAQLDYKGLADGTSMQLAVYLAAALQNGERPAGMFYQPVKRPVADEGKENDAQKQLCLSGMAVEGSDLPEQYNKTLTVSPEELDLIISYSLSMARNIAGRLLDGAICAHPALFGQSTACAYCDYGGICRFDSKLDDCKIRRIKPCDKEALLKKARGGNLIELD